MNVQIEESWKQHIGAEFEKPYFSRLVNFVRQEYSTTTCYPPGREIFNAFNLCPFDQVKVATRAGSLSRARTGGRSLLLGEGRRDDAAVAHQYLQGDQGRLGNGYAALGFAQKMGRTGRAAVECHADGEGASGGFASAARLEEFTDAVIQAVARDKEHVVYMLWGGFAKTKARIVDPQRNLVLQSAHPSPLSANRGGWFGNHHFSLCNDYLVRTGQAPIQW